jgi:hypothetical protein
MMRKPYGSLRFIAWLFEYCGVVIIMLTWVSVGYWFAYGSDDFHLMLNKDLDAAPFLVLVYGFAASLVGVFIIAAGQMIKLFLDIRDDVHRIEASHKNK